MKTTNPASERSNQAASFQAAKHEITEGIKHLNGFNRKADSLVAGFCDYWMWKQKNNSEL